MFKLITPKKINKQVSKFDKKTKQKILKLFTTLKFKPVPSDEYDVTKISRSDNTYRVKIIPIRVVYDVFWKEKEIHLIKVEKRKDRTYKKL